MNIEKVKAVFSDEAFVKALLKLETAAEVQTALKEKDVALAEEEIVAIRDLLLKAEQGEVTPEQLRLAEAGELSDEELEMVSGGGLVGWIIVGVVVAILSGALVTEKETDGNW